MIQFWVSLEKITHKKNSSDKYGWVCFQLISSIKNQVTKYVGDKNRMKGSWQSKSFVYDIVLIEIHNIRDLVDKYDLKPMSVMRELSELLCMTSSSFHESVIYTLK